MIKIFYVETSDFNIAEIGNEYTHYNDVVNDAIYERIGEEWTPKFKNGLPVGVEMISPIVPNYTQDGETGEISEVP